MAEGAVGQRDDTSGTADMKERAAASLEYVRKRLRNDPKGWAHLAVAAAVTILLSALLYWPLGLPGRVLTRALTRAADGSCVTTTTGIQNWFCGMGISLVAVSGAIVVIVVLLVLRKEVRKRSSRAVQRTPPEFHFLQRPVVVTLVFAMAWSSVLFHFYGRMGIVIEGLFPALVGLFVFALDRWDGAIKPRLGALWGHRERLPKPARLAVVILVPVLLGYLMTGWMPYGVRDQLAALLAVLIGWLMWTHAPEPVSTAPRRSTAATVALVALAGLAALVLLATPVSAQGPCADTDLYIAYVICESAHHSGTFGGASAGIGIGASAVVLAPSRLDDESEEEPKEEAPADPCGELQGRYDEGRAIWMLRHNSVQSMRKLVTRLEADYLARNESLFASQVANLAMQAVSVFRTRLPVKAPAPTSFLQRFGDTGQDVLVEAFMEQGVKTATDAGGPSGLDAIAAYDKTTAGTINTELKEGIKEGLRKKAAETLKETGTSIPPDSPVYQGMVNNMTTEAMEAFETFTAGVAGVTGLYGMLSKYGDMKGFADKIHELRMRIIDLDGENDMLKDTFQGRKYDLENCRERVAMGLEP